MGSILLYRRQINAKHTIKGERFSLHFFVGSENELILRAEE